MVLRKPRTRLDRPACTSVFAEYLISNINCTQHLTISAHFSPKQQRFLTYLFKSLGTVTEISVTLFLKCIIAATYTKTECVSRIALVYIASACATDLENSRIHSVITER